MSWIILFMILGVFSRNRVKGRKFTLAAFISLLFFTNPFVINFALDLWEVDAYDSELIIEPYEVGVLLGGSMRYYNDVIERPVYSQSVDRLLQTIALYKKGKIKTILLSGGSGRLTNPDEKESPIIKEVLLVAGVSEKDILMESKSRNTWENAKYSSQMIKDQASDGKVLVITSAWHMRRSLACFSKSGLKVEPYSVDERSGIMTYTPDRWLIPGTEPLTKWNALIHEWVGCLAYKMMGYI